MITAEDLRTICPIAKPGRIRLFLEPLNQAMRAYEIDITTDRTAAFIANVAQESGDFYYTLEIASGAAYEGREDLGNTEPGDGRRFKGRGLIQITGRANYTACGEALMLDLIESPELLEEPLYAAMSAGWYWRHGTAHDLNRLADAGEFRMITRLINGAATPGPPSHHAKRLAYLARAQETLA